jgi:hypothetical protein
MAQSTLARTQRLLWQLISAPEGAAAALAALEAGDATVAGSLVRPGGRLAPVERLEIYADMYFYRLRDCLQEDFPAVRAVVGEPWFHNLMTDYLLAHPPAHFSLRQAGRQLPGFIESHPVSSRWPFLGQLATLEWAMLDAFDAADAVPLEFAALQAVPPDDWPQLRFRLVPSLQWMRLDWRVDELRQRVHDQHFPAPDVPRRAATWLRVWRQNLRVFHRAIEPVEARALLAIAAGEPFALVCERVAELLPDVAEERAAELLSTWVADGVLWTADRSR